jgi:SNF2 family DNA or RNA helicase
MIAVHQATNSLVLRADDPLALRELIPQSKLIEYGEYNVAVKHTLEATKLLRNMGLPAPAPIRYTYNWPGKFKPFAHQLETSEFLTLHNKAFVLSSMGSGKTSSTLWAADWLMQQGLVRKVLILAPLSTLDRVWMQEIFDTLMHRVGVVVHGSQADRLDALKTNADFYILNHDGVTIKPVVEEIHRRPDIDLIIIDEGSMFRNHDTKKYKFLQKMLRPDQKLWLLTGTPCPNAPTDAWALARLVSPARVPNYIGSFRRQTMMQVSTFKWIPKPEAYEIAYEAMQPAIRFRKEDCIDLPPVTFEDRACELTPEQAKAFEAMRKEMQMEAKSTQINAVNAADKINKLRQILCGAIKDPVTEQYVTLPHQKRLAVLKECIAEAGAKVIVIVPFKGITNALEQEIKKDYTVGVLNGDVSPKMRNKIIADFKNTPDPHVLLCHPKVMSHGLNLTEADTLIFYAPIYSNDEAQQVVERFNRPGQKNKMTVIKMGAIGLEWEIYKLLDNKRVTQDNILNLYKSVTE